MFMTPRGPLNAALRPPGSKSLINRHLLCAALADGTSTLHGMNLCDDVRLMLTNLKRLGIRIEIAGDTARIHGCDGHIPEGDVQLDAGDAGTVMRFLTGLVTLGRGQYRLDGSDRMRQRPIGPLVDALGDLGAGIGYEAQLGFPPLTVMADGLGGGKTLFRRPQSSQFVSALLLIAPYALRDVLVAVSGGLPSRPYVDVTIETMRQFGVETLAADEHDRFIVAGGQHYQAGEFEIEPDASAATYFWAAAAICGGTVRVNGLSRTSDQADVAFIDRLEEMGCTVADEPDSIEIRGPRDGLLRGIRTDMNALPDAVQTLAVTALFAASPTEIRNVANLRIKETDRLTALAVELRKLGATVELFDDGLRIEPPRHVSPARIETYNDHRMAMSFALAGLRAPGIEIADPGCVSKSFPDYFNVLASL